MYFLPGSPADVVSGIGATEIPIVHDRHAERRQALAEPGNAEGGRPHVDAAAVAAEVERHADDVNGTHGAHCSTRPQVDEDGKYQIR